jgi:PKD repeat protein
MLPLSIKATVNAKDLERDKVTYVWNLGNGTTKETTTPQVDYTYTVAGDYKISVEVKDDKGASSKSDVTSVYAGNEAPMVSIDLSGGNKSFYLPGVPLRYSVTVNDKNDTAKINPKICMFLLTMLKGPTKQRLQPVIYKGMKTLTEKI